MYPDKSLLIPLENFISSGRQSWYSPTEIFGCLQKYAASCVFRAVQETGALTKQSHSLYLARKPYSYSNNG